MNRQRDKKTKKKKWYMKEDDEPGNISFHASACPMFNVQCPSSPSSQEPFLFVKGEKEKRRKRKRKNKRRKSMKMAGSN